MTNEIITQVKKKAAKSLCRFKIGAVAIDHEGNVIGRTFNKPSDCRTVGNKYHAERILIERYKGNIKTIVICRTNNRGDFMPIDACHACASLADKYGITIVSLMPGKE